MDDLGALIHLNDLQIGSSIGEEARTMVGDRFLNSAKFVAFTDFRRL